MQRRTPGPFGGIFDDIDYESPGFIPVVVFSVLLKLSRSNCGCPTRSCGFN
jgi:hypothetical protein